MDNDQPSLAYHSPCRAADCTYHLDIRMTLEERYAAQWRKDARAEGHRKGVPASQSATGSMRHPEAYAAILQSVQKGNSCIATIAENTGYSRQFVQDRLRYLNTHGKIVKVGNQWRVKE